MATSKAVHPPIPCGDIVDDKLSSFQCDHRPYISLVSSHISMESQYGARKKDRVDVHHGSRDLVGT